MRNVAQIKFNPIFTIGNTLIFNLNYVKVEDIRGRWYIVRDINTKKIHRYIYSYFEKNFKLVEEDNDIIIF